MDGNTPAPFECFNGMGVCLPEADEDVPVLMRTFLCFTGENILNNIFRDDETTNPYH
jgi:hypothetical protein